MTTQGLPDEIAKLVGQETEFGPWGADPVSLAMIHHWCEALEDGNPVYSDEASAKSNGYSGIFAPPTMAQAFSRGPMWPARPPETGMQLPFEGYESLVVRNNLEFLEPLYVGDNLHGKSKLVEISPERVTRVGTGHFVTNMRILANQRDETVSTWSLTTLRYPRGSAAKEGAPGGSSGAGAPPSQQARDRRPEETRRWDDVQEGDTFQPIALPVTVTRLVMLANATRDFYEVHHDKSYALANGARDIFVNNTAYAGFMNRIVTDWGGPGSRLRALDFSMREMNCPDDVMKGTGRVVKKYVSDEGRRLVELSLLISNQNGPTTTATATAELP